MPKPSLKDLSHKLVFVCYAAGTGGERLSVEISQLSGFRKLAFYRTNNGRTVITNDIFRKYLLFASTPFLTLLDLINGIDGLPYTDKHRWVSPSHWDVPYLIDFFPRSQFIRILSPDKQIVADLCKTKILQDALPTFLEFVGFCKGHLTDNEFHVCLRKKELVWTMTVQEILEVIRAKNLTKQHCPNTYHDLLTQPNVFDVHYDDLVSKQPLIVDFLLQSAPQLQPDIF